VGEIENGSHVLVLGMGSIVAISKGLSSTYFAKRSRRCGKLRS
jgi:hypothetical protein